MTTQPCEGLRVLHTDGILIARNAQGHEPVLQPGDLPGLGEHPQ